MLESDNDAVNSGKYPIQEPLRTFLYFNDRINIDGKSDSYSKSKDLWEDVRRVFHIMEGWFNDSVMYNLIGYHRAVKGGKTLSYI